MTQLGLTFERRGGARKGAGRKPNGEKAGVSHLARPLLAPRFPVLVTMRMREHMWNLRSKRAFRRIRAAFLGVQKNRAFRLTHYSVQGNHMHLLVEAKDKAALARGMQGLSIRVAKGLNGVMGASGAVFADRYHSRILKSPREVRHSLSYVLCNARRHGIMSNSAAQDTVDPFSSGLWFDGWRSKPRCEPWRIAMVDGATGPPTAAPRTWLLRVGWRKHGLLDPKGTSLS